MKTFCLFVFLLAHIQYGWSLWCYRCVGSHPGCGLYDFDWRFYWSHYCNDPLDKCVKIIEEKGSSVMVTRDCLSNLEAHRKDIPADRYEGCRPAAEEILLGQYIFPSIPEIDHKRTYYDKVTYCFCDFDERCNGVGSISLSVWIMVSLLTLHRLLWA